MRNFTNLPVLREAEAQGFGSGMPEAIAVGLGEPTAIDLH